MFALHHRAGARGTCALKHIFVHCNILPVVVVFSGIQRINVFANRDAKARHAETTGVQGNPYSCLEGKENTPSASQRARCPLPRSTVYLSMRRLGTTNDIDEVIGRALKRETDGVLEAPQQSTAVLFLDDVNVAQEV